MLRIMHVKQPSQHPALLAVHTSPLSCGILLIPTLHATVHPTFACPCVCPCFPATLESQPISIPTLLFPFCCHPVLSTACIPRHAWQLHYEASTPRHDNALCPQLKYFRSSAASAAISSRVLTFLSASRSSFSPAASWPRLQHRHHQSQQERQAGHRALQTP